MPSTLSEVSHGSTAPDPARWPPHDLRLWPSRTPCRAAAQNMTLVRDALAESIAADGATARVVIVAHAGSTPRETGTDMLVTARGIQGTIGGGALEHQAIARAQALLHTGKTRRLDRQPLGPALAQCCGGSVTLLTEVFTAQGLEQIPGRGVFARPVDDKAAETAPLKVQRAERDARSGEPAVHVYSKGWFAEPVEAALTPLWIYGAGHVGRALVTTLEGLPFDVTWVDDARPRFPDHPPDHVTMLVAADPAAAAALAPPQAQHLVLTYSHALDLALCHQILGQLHGRLGLIGSATKRARFSKRLIALGHSPASVGQMICPIGDPTLGKHPRAIAVSIVHALLSAPAVAHPVGQTA